MFVRISNEKVNPLATTVDPKVAVTLNRKTSIDPGKVVATPPEVNPTNSD